MVLWTRQYYSHVTEQETEAAKKTGSSGHLRLKDTQVSGKVMRWRKYYFPKLLSEKDLQVDEKVALISCWRKEGGRERSDRYPQGLAIDGAQAVFLLRRDGTFEDRASLVLSRVCKSGIGPELFCPRIPLLTVLLPYHCSASALNSIYQQEEAEWKFISVLIDRSLLSKNLSFLNGDKIVEAGKQKDKYCLT